MPAILAHLRAQRVDGAPAAEPSLEAAAESVRALLAETTLCAWATVTAGAEAHLNIGYFAHTDGLELYLLSHPSALHCRNLGSNPSMAVAVYASTQQWTEPGRGIQLFGTCAEVPPAEGAEAERLYSDRFPSYTLWKAAMKPGDPGLAYRFYRFLTQRVKILDEPAFGDAVLVEADVVRASD